MKACVLTFRGLKSEKNDDRTTFETGVIQLFLRPIFLSECFRLSCMFRIAGSPVRFG